MARADLPQASDDMERTEPARPGVDGLIAGQLDQSWPTGQAGDVVRAGFERCWYCGSLTGGPWCEISAVDRTQAQGAYVGRDDNESAALPGVGRA